MFEATITGWPAFTQGIDTRASFHAALSEADDDVGALVVADLVGQTTGAVAEGWGHTVVDRGGVLEAVITNSFAPTKYLDKGASWPGPMPPWGPDTPLAEWARARGYVPFLVARALKAKGLTARHFVPAALSREHAAILHRKRQAIRDWLRLMGGRG